MLPAAGYRNYYSSGALYYRGYYGYYWSSSEDTSSSYAWDLHFNSGYANTHLHYYRLYGFSVRCISDDSSQPQVLSLDKSILSLDSGDIGTVIISGGTGYYTVSNSNSQVATAVISGNSVEVASLSSGSATITVEDTSGETATISVTVTSTVSESCGAFVAHNVWKEFDCYNLAAIGKTTNDDPFTPSWRLIGGYWQWGRKGPDTSQWYDTNTEHFAHGPTGSGEDEANEDSISSWDDDYAPDGSWSDSEKTANDPCPAGYRVPTRSQWDGVIYNNTQSTVGTWSTTGQDHTNYSVARFFGNDLMLPAAGYRNYNSGALHYRGLYGFYWSSSGTTRWSSNAWYLYVYSGDASTYYISRRLGFSVRCISE